MVWPWWSVLGSGEAGRNLAQNLAPNLARNQEKKSRILGGFCARFRARFLPAQNGPNLAQKSCTENLVTERV